MLVPPCTVTSSDDTAWNRDQIALLVGAWCRQHSGTVHLGAMGASTMAGLCSWHSMHTCTTCGLFVHTVQKRLFQLNTVGLLASENSELDELCLVAPTLERHRLISQRHCIGLLLVAGLTCYDRSRPALCWAKYDDFLSLQNECNQVTGAEGWGY